MHEHAFRSSIELLDAFRYSIERSSIQRRWPLQSGKKTTINMGVALRA